MPSRPALPPNSKLRRDGRIEVRVQVDGRRISRYARSPEDAWALYAELAVERQRGRLSRSGWTVAEWLERRLASRRGLAPSTVREERRLARIINEAFGAVSLEDLTPMQIKTWVDGLDYSHRTQLMVLRMLRTALDEAVALELISRNPAAPIKLQRKPRQTTATAWTLDEATRFVQASRGRRLYPLYLTLLTLGLRIGEAMALRLEDWDFDDALGLHRMRIRRTATEHGRGHRVSEQTKTPASRRTLYLPEDLAGVMGSWLERRNAEAALPSWTEEGWLFPASNGRMLTYSNVRRDFRAACEVAGLEPIRLHDLRHTAANLMRQRGVAREVRMQMLGHQNRDVHDIYARHVEAGEVVRAARALEGLFGASLDPIWGHWGQQKKKDGEFSPS